jgi:hypothetical protein
VTNTFSNRVLLIECKADKAMIGVQELMRQMGNCSLLFKKKPSSEIKLQLTQRRYDKYLLFTKDLKGTHENFKEFYQDPKRAGFITAKAGMNSFVWNMRYQMQLQLTELM